MEVRRVLNDKRMSMRLKVTIDTTVVKPVMTCVQSAAGINKLRRMEKC